MLEFEIIRFNAQDVITASYVAPPAEPCEHNDVVFKMSDSFGNGTYFCNDCPAQAAGNIWDGLDNIQWNS